MLSGFANALETIFGAALVPAAAVLRWTATFCLLAALLLSARSIVRAVAAWRYGWVPGTLVRCPRCGKFASDPGLARCPAGHEVRFPASTLRRLSVPETGARRASRHAYPIVLAVFLGAVTAGGYVLADVSGRARPISTITACLAFLFLCAAICAAGFALRPRPSGAIARILHSALAAACLFPALVLVLLATAFEPPAEHEIGSLWTTPTALYLARGGRARRAGPAAGRLEARTIDASVPGLGIVWEGLEGFELAGRDVPWRGKGGTAARFLGWWFARSDSRPGFFRRSVQIVALEPNRRVRILAARDHVRFVPEP